MIRITETGSSYYGFEFDDIESEAENIEQLANEGFPVIIVNDLEDLMSGMFIIGPSDVQMIAS